MTLLVVSVYKIVWSKHHLLNILLEIFLNNSLDSDCFRKLLFDVNTRTCWLEGWDF